MKKYGSPKTVKEDIEGKPVYLPYLVDVSSLRKEKEKLITQEQCEGIVTIASDLLKIMSKTDFVYFLNKNQHTFHFDIVYFIKSYNLNCYIKEARGDFDAVTRAIKNIDVFNQDSYFSVMDFEKIVTTYTNLTSFCEYIEKYPLDKNDILKIISTERNH